MSSTPPVSEKEFHYASGDLYVEASGANRHRRESVADLKSLFHPKGNNTRKDPPAHWYEAQLIHYGLPPSKTKGTAVKRLLDAVNSGNLSVPKHITALEKSLKKQWDANDRQTKKEIKDAAAKGQSTGQGKKRKAPESASAATALNSEAPPKKSKTATSTARQDAAGSTSRAKKSTSVAKAPPVNPTAPSPRPKQTAKRTGGPPRGASSKVPVGGKVTTATKRSTAGDKGKPPTKAKLKKEPQTSFKRESSPFDAVMTNSAIHTSPLGYINGHYTIDCPYIEREWSSSIPEDGLSLTLCLDTPRIWGSFEFGVFEGVALIPERPLKASTEVFPLYMRGRETGEGEMFFDDGNVGEIVFSGGGVIEGFINLPYTGMQEFSGRRQEGPPHVGMLARQLQYEWDGYNEEQYEEERKNRWR